MKQRNPFAVFALPIVTFGIYGIVWAVKTKREMVEKGAEIPTSWLIAVPFVSIYWYYKHSQGVEHVTGGKQSAAMAFVLQFLLGSIGMAIIQSEFNKLGDSPVDSLGIPTSVPAAAAGVQPDASFGGPVAPVATEAVQQPAFASAPVKPATEQPSDFSMAGATQPQVIAPSTPTYSDPTNPSQPPTTTPPVA